MRVSHAAGAPGGEVKLIIISITIIVVIISILSILNYTTYCTYISGRAPRPPAWPRLAAPPRGRRRPTPRPALEAAAGGFACLQVSRSVQFQAYGCQLSIARIYAHYVLHSAAGLTCVLTISMASRQDQARTLGHRAEMSGRQPSPAEKRTSRSRPPRWAEAPPGRVACGGAGWSSGGDAAAGRTLPRPPKELRVDTHDGAFSGAYALAPSPRPRRWAGGPRSREPTG